MAETSRLHAEEKDEEVKLYEKSVEELEFIVNALESQVRIKRLLLFQHFLFGNFTVYITSFGVIMMVLICCMLRLTWSKERLKGNDCNERN